MSKHSKTLRLSTILNKRTKKVLTQTLKYTEWIDEIGKLTRELNDVDVKDVKSLEDKNELLGSAIKTTSHIKESLDVYIKELEDLKQIIARTLRGGRKNKTKRSRN